MRYQLIEFLVMMITRNRTELNLLKGQNSDENKLI